MASIGVPLRNAAFIASCSGRVAGVSESLRAPHALPVLPVTGQRAPSERIESIVIS